MLVVLDRYKYVHYLCVTRNFFTVNLAVVPKQASPHQ